MKNPKLSFKVLLSAHLTAIALFFTAIPTTVHAEAPLCADIFSFESQQGALFAKTTEQIKSVDKSENSPKFKKLEDLSESLKANYEKRNGILSERYPDLKFVFKDPEAFVTTMKARFEAQKKITPEDPRLFNFPEVAPTMRDVQTDLVKFREEVVADLKKQKASLRNRVALKVKGKESSKVEMDTKVIEYIDKLQKDIEQMITTGKYPYRDSVHAVYFYSRIRGIFQFKELNTYYQVAKYIDMVMHGYRRLSIDQELRLYEETGSPILQVRSGKIAKEFRIAELPFRDAFDRTDVLEYVVIPSVYALGSSAMMHVLPHRIHFFGATNTPIAADGFKRPGGLFWMHDVRHEADRYMKITAYRKAQNLTAKQELTLSLLMQQWHAEFLVMKNAVQDPNLKAALDHYHFYTHHDVGVPLVPSLFLDHHADGRSVFYAFLFHKKWAGQTPNFNDWFKATRDAAAILTKFWEERLPLERQLLQKEPVHIKNWDEWFPMNHPSESKLSVLNKAVESKSLVRVRTGITGVDGVLSKVIYGPQREPIYVQFTGKAQLLNRVDEVIPGQGPESHQDGYSAPIGKIKTVRINGREASLSELSANQKVEIQYESGVVVRGDLRDSTLDVANTLTVLTFTTAEVTLNGKVLYNPAWGKFDLIMGETVQSIEFL
jgi:hypothetical protein